MTQTITREIRKAFEANGYSPDEAGDLALIALTVRGMQSQPRMDTLKYIKSNNDFYKIITTALPNANRSAVFAVKDKLIADIEEMIKVTIQEADVNVDMKTEFLARGGTIEEAKMFDRICKAFLFDMMPLTDSAREVYRWIAEQESSGQRLEKFVAWARGADRAQYINKYRKDAGNIRNDWALAFPVTQGRTTEYI